LQVLAEVGELLADYVTRVQRGTHRRRPSSLDNRRPRWTALDLELHYHSGYTQSRDRLAQRGRLRRAQRRHCSLRSRKWRNPRARSHVLLPARRSDRTRCSFALWLRPKAGFGRRPCPIQVGDRVRQDTGPWTIGDKRKPGWIVSVLWEKSLPVPAAGLQAGKKTDREVGLT